jgi:LacI family transcriptional regulator
MAYHTQSDIANKLKVSRVTVSKALRDHPDISFNMKRRVKEIAEEFGYTPNLIAKNLTSKKTLTIGIVVPDLENSFFSYAVDSMVDAASEHHYHTILTVSRESEQNEKYNIQSLIGMRVDGLLVCVSQRTSDSHVFEEVKKKNIPFVFFDRQLEGMGFKSVIFNDEIGAIDALDQIIKNGYSSIAHFAGYLNVSIGQKRCKGYRIALEKNGLKIDPAWILEAGFEIQDGYNSFMKLYQAKKIPDIIFTVNDRVALGAYKAIKEVGMDIPKDIGIMGFGFSETAQMFSPTLSIIHQDPRKLGTTALEVLIEEIQNPMQNKTRNIIIEEKFIWNNSIIKK